jgi:hypothetical protein
VSWRGDWVDVEIEEIVNSPFVATFNFDVAHLLGCGVTIPNSLHGLIHCVKLEALVGLRRKCVADGRSP